MFLRMKLMLIAAHIDLWTDYISFHLKSSHFFMPYRDDNKKIGWNSNICFFFFMWIFWRYILQFS